MNRPRIRPQKRVRGRKNKKSPALAVIVLLGVVILAFTPYFKINDIIIEGNSHIDDEYICRVSGISHGMNIFSVKLSEVKENLTREAYIHDAKVKRVFPNDISIVVTESDPVAVIPYTEGQFVLLDEYASALDILEVENGEYPEITGLSISLTDENFITAARKEDKEKAELIPSLLAQFVDSSIRDRILEININDIDNIRFIMNGGKMEARLCGPEDMDYKLKMLSAIVEKLDAEGKTEGIIDFSGADPVYRPEDEDFEIPDIDEDEETLENDD